MTTAHTTKQIKHAINGVEFLSTYKITTRAGFNGVALECVEVDHAYKDGRVVASNTISNHESPDVAFRAYKKAIEKKEWGVM